MFAGLVLEVVYANDHLFREISYLTMVCLVWIIRNRHQATVHSLTLTWASDLSFGRKALTDTALKKRISCSTSCSRSCSGQLALGKTWPGSSLRGSLGGTGGGDQNGSWKFSSREEERARLKHNSIIGNMISFKRWCLYWTKFDERGGGNQTAVSESEFLFFSLWIPNTII